MDDTMEERGRKRRRLSHHEADISTNGNIKHLPHTLTSTISPPSTRRSRRDRECNESFSTSNNGSVSTLQGVPSKVDLFPERRRKVITATTELEPSTKTESESVKVIKSPFQLTWIRDLPESLNKDAVSLKDILGNPLIAKCWEFNYMHDLDFLMDAFDPDIKDLVQVNVVHGFWKNEDESRLRLKTQAAAYPNLKLLTAYMPEMYGTHHSKMMVLIRHDDCAQIVIHTANMIAFDWTNMTQAVWRSPLLPKKSDIPDSGSIGTGSRFKTDFMNYLRAYNSQRTICKSLIEELSRYDFSAIRGALVASVPSKQVLEGNAETSWGWAGLTKVLEQIPVRALESEIAIQISSIASLGATNKWLAQTFLESLRKSRNKSKSKSNFKVIFPTADEIRRSLNGYASGSSIHTKIQTAAQIKQLQYLKPMLYHWAGDSRNPTSSSSATTSTSPSIHTSGRARAAPHIKTYTRFSSTPSTNPMTSPSTSPSLPTIDWILLTSANLSKQAWGESPNSANEIRICSYEIGVLVWPELFGENATMVPTFQSDTPAPPSPPPGHSPSSEGTRTGNVAGDHQDTILVGVRMPYDLPLVPYGKDEEPWCATKVHHEPDWTGRGYGV